MDNKLYGRRAMLIYSMLVHVEISMIITALIGIFGMIVEPGPVPYLMAVVGLTYSTLYGMASLARCYFYARKENLNGRNRKRAHR